MSLSDLANKSYGSYISGEQVTLVWILSRMWTSRLKHVTSRAILLEPCVAAGGAATQKSREEEAA